MTSEAAELYATLAAALGEASVRGDRDSSDFIERLKAHYAKGVWTKDEVPELADMLDRAANGWQFRITSDVGQDYNESIWQVVLRLYGKVFAEDQLIAPLHSTLVKTLNTYLPAAFTASAGAEYLVVVDNAFHDFLYYLCKLLVTSFDPVPTTDDPTWRAEGARYEGRLDTTSRLLRLYLGHLRWTGLDAKLVRTLLPRKLTEQAISLAEEAHVFVLAHEAAHILRGHLSSDPMQLAVAGTNITTVSCQHAAEHEADVLGTQAVVELAAEEGLTKIRPTWFATQTAHLLFTALALFEEAYFVLPPTTHPEPISRVEEVLRRVANVVAGDTIEIDSVLNAPVILPLARLVEASSDPEIHVRPLNEVLSDALDSPHFVATRDIDDQQMVQLALIDFREFMLSLPDCLGPLSLIGKSLIDPYALRHFPRKLRRAIIERGRSNSSHIPESKVDAIILAELGRYLVLSKHPMFRLLRDRCWSPESGTPFFKWVRTFPEVSDQGLFSAIVKVSTAAVRQGTSSLSILDEDLAEEAQSWAKKISIGNE